MLLRSGVHVATVLVGITVMAGVARGEDAAPAGRFATMDGKKVHYVERGEGTTTLVLVHGWASDMTVWDDNIGEFAEKMRVIAIDLPGHGKSDEPSGPYSMDLFAKAIAAVMDDARVERAVLVGHSNGTPTIRQFYRLFPERTQALVIVDGALKQMMPAEAVKPFLEKFKGEDYKETVAQFCQQIPMLDDAMKLRIAEMGARTSQSAIIGGMEANMDPAIWKEDPIHVPTLCVMAQSPFWTPDYETQIRVFVPDLDYRVVEGASHFLHMQTPEKFNGMVIEYLVARNFIAP